jgi:hypothetical protein
VSAMLCDELWNADPRWMDTGVKSADPTATSSSLGFRVQNSMCGSRTVCCVLLVSICMEPQQTNLVVHNDSSSIRALCNYNSLTCNIIITK